MIRCGGGLLSVLLMLPKVETCGTHYIQWEFEEESKKSRKEERKIGQLEPIASSLLAVAASHHQQHPCLCPLLLLMLFAFIPWDDDESSAGATVDWLVERRYKPVSNSE
ncbi:hypothetical protein quinque_014531 [Culex quinquefasciatus]